MATTITMNNTNNLSAARCISAARSNKHRDAVLVVVVHSPGTTGAPRRVRTRPSVSAAELLALLNVPAGSSVRYSDPDGDVCTLGTDAELAEALRCAAVRKPTAVNKHGVGAKERLVLHVRVHTPPAAAAARAAAATDDPTARSSSAATAAPRAGGLGGAAHRALKPKPAVAKRTVGLNRAAAKKPAAAAAAAVDPAARVAARVSLLERRLTAVTAAADACADKPARAAMLEKRQAMLRSKIADVQSKPVGVAKPLRCVQKPTKTPIEPTKPSLEQRLANNAERSAKLQSRIAELKQQWMAALAAGKAKRAAVLDSRIVKLSEKLTAVQQRRALMTSNQPKPSNTPIEKTKSIEKTKAIEKPKAIEKTKPTKPSLEQRLAHNAERSAKIQSRIAELKQQSAAAHAAGKAKRAAVLDSRIVKLNEKLTAVQQRRAMMTSNHVSKPKNTVSVAHFGQPSQLMPLLARVPTPVAVQHLQRVLAMLKQHQAVLDRRIALVESQLAKRNGASM